MFVLPITLKNPVFTLMICGGTKSEDSNPASDACLQISPDLDTPVWTQAPSLPTPRLMPDSVILPDGTVVIVNGLRQGEAGGGLQGNCAGASDPVFQADHYDPITRIWTTLASASNLRLYHSGALLIETGEVITFGSEMDNYNDYWTANDTLRNSCFPTTNAICTQPFNYNIERFSPPYMHQATLTGRPKILAIPGKLSYGSLIAIAYTSPNPIKKVTMIKLGSVTHSTNTDQRLLEVVVVASTADMLYIKVPLVNFAPPGNYFVFILDGNGVPSVAFTVLLGIGPATLVAIPATANVSGNMRTSLGWIQSGWILVLAILL